MTTQVAAFRFGGQPPKRRPRKPFPLGAPRALIEPVRGLLEMARAMSGARRAGAYSMEGREVTLLAIAGDGEMSRSRFAARALAHGTVILETDEQGYVCAIPMASRAPSGSERRRFRPRSTVASACLVLEGDGERPEQLDEATELALTESLLAAIESRSFADAVATDRTTGALNRAAFERAAGNELEVAGASERPAALLLIEVVLRRTSVEVELAEEVMSAAARVLREALRAEDLIGRRGPDELAVLLVDADLTHLPNTCQRVLARLEAEIAPLGVDAPVIGVAGFPDHGASLEALDAAALDAQEGAREAGPGNYRLFDPSLGRSATATRKSFFTGDPGLDARKATLLFESVLAANSARALDEALDAVLRALLTATGADRAAVLSGEGANLEIAAARDHRFHTLEPPMRISRSACLRALALGRATYVADTNAQGSDISRSALELRLRSVVTVPLLGRSGPVGVLYADSVRPSFRGYTPEELAYLEALSAQAALAIENATLRQRLTEENAALKRVARSCDDSSPIIGSSVAMRTALKHLPEMVESPSSVLLLGESGTGKELLARTLHRLSSRDEGNFVAQNCAAIPLELLESELFGHAAGAFSGAARNKRGLIELADGGTFFLDEVGDLPAALQAKLLRVLEDKEVRRVGETRSQKIDFRLICATNRDLEREVEEGRFRRDLYYRINVFTVTLPPLRERRSDIPELTIHFVGRSAERLGRPRPDLSQAALRALEQAPWPGNVRELANVIEKAVTLAHDGVIEPEHFGLAEARRGRAPQGTLRETLAQVEREAVRDALIAQDGNVSATARSLGLARQQVQRLIRRHGLRIEET